MQKVSIVIPTYNRAKYLTQALDSVLQQTYQHFEIIVIDDGSTDDTKNVMEEYMKRFPNKIKYFYEKNKGPAAARNRGINEAMGDYIAFLDSDDMWMPTKLAEQVEFLDHNKGVALVFTDIKKMKDNKIIKEASLGEEGVYNRNKFSELIEKSFIFTPTVAVRKNILIEIGLFNEKYRAGEDYELYLRIAKHHDIEYINKPLAIRRLHDSNTPTLLFYEAHLVLLNDLVHSNSFNKHQKNIFMVKLRQFSYELGYYYFSRGEYKRSIKWFYKACGTNHGIKPFFYIFAALLPSLVINYLRKLKQDNFNKGVL